MSAFLRGEFEMGCELLAKHYEKSAPTIASWCDWLCSAKDEEVTLADIRILDEFCRERPQANYAANKLYKHFERMNRETTGQAGY